VPSALNSNNKDNQPIRPMKTIRFLTFAALAAALLLQTPISRADGHGQRGDDHGKKGDGHGQRGDNNGKGDRDCREAQTTFTKWIIAPFPPSTGIFANMGGVVGGDVGAGSFIGEALTFDLDGSTGVITIEAVYHFHGSKHSFTANVHVVQTGLIGVVTGVITDGWRKGHVVEGQYTQVDCDKAPTFTCYQGTLEIEDDSND